MTTAHVPEVWLCLATSLDGRIAESADEMPRFTSRYDRNKLFGLRAQADALLIGAGTVRAEQLPPLIRNRTVRERRIRQGLKPHPPAVVVSNSLNLPWDGRYFGRDKQDVLVMCSGATPEQRKLTESRGIGLIETGAPFSLARGIARLGDLGYHTILAEGGGRLVHALLSEDLVDRFYLTLAPTVIAGENTPLLCSGPQLSPRARLALESTHVEGSELHLVYKRAKKAHPPAK
ncbi:MAG: dihydrofolate reductase family protein [Acidobacteriota bacterium]|nr:dihydrofolate reductase family protein [Acidobacteriota bacterium]